MSCNLQKVVDAAYDLLKKVPNTSADVASTLKLIEDKKKVLAALTTREKLLQHGMKSAAKVRQANMNMLAKAVQQKKADDLKQLKDSAELQMLTTGVSVDSMPTEYYAMMKNLVDTVVKPGYVNKPEAMFLHAMEGKILAGSYNTATNTVQTSELTEAEITEQAKTLTIEWLAEQLVSKESSDEVYVSIVEAIKNDTDVMNMLADDISERAADMIAMYAQIKGSHALYHELVHAGAARFMRANPEDVLTKKMHELYEVALSKSSEIASLMEVNEHDKNSMYWTINVDEFVAEALTNPLLIKALAKIKVDEVKALRRSNSVFGKILDVALEMLGISNTDNLYAEVLSTYTQILEAQIAAPADKKSLRSVGISEVFSKEEKRHFANPLMRALIKDLKPRIVEKDISADVLIAAIKDNVANMILGKNITLTVDAIDKMYVSGAYNSITNTLYHPGRKVDVTDDVLNSALDNSIQKLVDALPELNKEEVKALAEPEWSRAIARAVLNRHRELKKSTTGRIPIEVLLHELGHALTENFIAVNPDHEVVLELSSIFEHVKPLLMKDSYFAETDTYWQQDMEEFLSEALSNPRLIKKLASIPVHDVTDINNVLEAIVKFVSKLFGKAEHTMYDAIMYRLAQIAEYGDNTESAKALLIATKEGNKMSTNTLTDRLGSIQSPKAKEIILELTKDCR